MKNLLLAFFTLLTFSAIAQNVVIPDANFKAYLLAHPQINTNSDTEIQMEEAIAFGATIDCRNLGIVDLTGVETFVNIVSLVCNKNLLTTLDLSQQTKLRYLDCRENQLSDLDVSQKRGIKKHYFVEKTY